MHSIGMDDVGSALIITFGLLSISILVVGIAMWWLYKVFKNKDTDSQTNSQDDTHTDV